MICLFAMQYFSATSALSTVLWTATITAVIIRLAMSDRENKTLLKQVRTDSLTGLGSRGRVQLDLPARFAEATVEDPISLVLLDLNGFKHFNDSFGHPAGDTLLIRFGAALRDAVGSAGTAYRFGGDEFCLLPDLPPRPIRRSHRGRGPRAQRPPAPVYDINASWGSIEIPAEATGPRRGAQARRRPDVREQGLAAGGDHRLRPGRAGRDACRLPCRDRITSADKAIPVQEVGPCPIPISAARSTFRPAGFATGRPVRGPPSSSSTDTSSTDGSGTGRRPALRHPPLPRSGLADRRPADRDEVRRGPHPLWDRRPRSPAFLEALDLDDVTIIANDSGGAMSQVLVTRHPERIGRLVLTNCDTHENFPPGIFGAMPKMLRCPAGQWRPSPPRSRIGALARAAFRPFTRDPLPADLVASWMKPGLSDPGVKRDVKKVTVGMNKRYTLEAAEKLKELPSCRSCWRGRPATASSRSSTPSASPRTPPNANIAPISDAKTFVPVDQPQQLAGEIATFIGSP